MMERSWSVPIIFSPVIFVRAVSPQCPCPTQADLDRVTSKAHAQEQQLAAQVQRLERQLDAARATVTRREQELFCAEAEVCRRALAEVPA